MHSAGEFAQFVIKCFGDGKITGSGSRTNINVLCPVCEETRYRFQPTDKKKLAIKLDSGICHCWTCGFKAKSIISLLRRFRALCVPEYLSKYSDPSLEFADTDNASEAIVEGVLLPTGFQLLAPWWGKEEEAPAYIRQALHYLTKERGLGERELWYFKYGVTELEPAYRNRVLIPSHDTEGKVNFFTGRSFKSNVKPPYLNPPFQRETVIFNEINVDWTEELTVVEGPFDLSKVNDNAVPLLGKVLTKKCALYQKLAENNTPVLLCLDNDARKTTLRLAKMLYDNGLPVRIMELPEGVKDPGVLALGEFNRLKEECSEQFDELYFLRNLVR